MLNLRSYLISNYLIYFHLTVPLNEQLFNLCHTYRPYLIRKDLIYAKITMLFNQYQFDLC